ncbi:MAG: hypothetical protein ACI4IM_01645 [Acutalibacteraceae bacterium]
MSERTCYYCYNRKKCKGVPFYDENGTCTEWRPFVVPRRYLKHIAEEFYSSACASAAHIYNDIDRAYIQRMAFRLASEVAWEMEVFEQSGNIPDCSDISERQQAARYLAKNRKR